MHYVPNLPYVAASLFVKTNRLAGAAPSYEITAKSVKPWRNGDGILFRGGKCQGYEDSACHISTAAWMNICLQALDA